MRAVILAAGRGSRMGGLTDDIPKCLTPLAGKPLIQWQLDALHQVGITKIAVVRGYLAEKLQSDAYMVFDNYRWSETNMVASLACATEWLEAQTCIVSYGDIVYHPDVVKRLINAEGVLAITYDRLWYELWVDRFDEPLSDAETFQIAQDGTLLEIGRCPTSLDEVQGQYMGLLKFTPESWSQVKRSLDTLSPERRDKLDMTGLLRYLLTKGMTINITAVDGRWCEVDREQDLLLYESRLKSPDGWSHDWRPNNVKESAVAW